MLDRRCDHGVPRCGVESSWYGELMVVKMIGQSIRELLHAGFMGCADSLTNRLLPG